MSLIKIPLSVPERFKAEYRKNYKIMTANTGNLFLIAGDQKIEHLNDDFHGNGIAPEDGTPEHLFKIAAQSPKAVLGLPLGLISKYGEDYRKVNYLVKLNGKTNLGPNEEKNSSKPLWTVEDVVKLKKQSGLKIAAVGYTIYLGGKYESQMLAEASQMINEAHSNGLLTLIWMYPRSKDVNEEDAHIIAGGAGVAASLGTDFVKVKYPYNNRNKKQTAEKFKEVVRAAGRTKIVCVGGKKKDDKIVLEYLKNQLKVGTAGLAIGRNLHQLPLADAIRLSQKISKTIFPTKKKQATSNFLGLF